MQYLHSYLKTCIHHIIHPYSPYIDMDTFTTHIDNPSYLCLYHLWIWSVSAFPSHSGAVVRCIWAWFSSALSGNLLLGTALVILFGHSSFFFFGGGWKPSRFAAETTLKTFQTVALSCAKIWGRFPDVCVDEDYLALKRIPSWSVQCCCKSTIWEMPWYLNSTNCTQTETDLSDPVTLFYRME